MPSNIHAVVAVSVLIQVGLSFITPSNSADPFLHWLFAHAIDAGRSIHYQKPPDVARCPRASSSRIENPFEVI